MHARIFGATLIGLAATMTNACADDAARHWYILSGGDSQCHAATEVMSEHPTPDALHGYLRAGGVTDAVKVHKSNSGEVLFVTISVMENGGQVGVVWFPSQSNCEIMREVAQRHGMLPNDSDLK